MTDSYFFICPFCGAELSVEAIFCRHCGSDAETGWNTNTENDLPPYLDTSYEDIVEQEFEPTDRIPRSWSLFKKTLFILAILIISLFLVNY